MTCVHLQQLYRLCQDHDLKLSGSDLIHIVCNQCGVQDVCPSMLTDEYDAKHPEADASLRVKHFTDRGDVQFPTQLSS